MTSDRPQQMPAADLVRYPFEAGDEHWVASWHPADQPPNGVAHGSAGVCLTAAREVVLISEDGSSWDLPGGRPEGDESWQATFEREVLEEACASVRSCVLVGFLRGECLVGAQRGLVLMRSIWASEVEVHRWEPRFEIRHREVLAPSVAIARLDFRRSPEQIYRRAFLEAGLS